MTPGLNHPGRNGYRMIGIVLGATILLLGLLAAVGGSRSAQASPATDDKPGGTAPDSVEATCPPGGQCFADVLPSNPFYPYINTLYTQDIVGGYGCVNGTAEPCDSASRPYFRWTANVTRGQLSKFVANARSQPGIVISSSLLLNPIIASTNAPGYSAIQARSVSGPGLSVSSQQTFAIHAVAGAGNPGILAENTSTGNGVWGRAVSANGVGVYGENTGSGFAVLGQGNSGTGVYGTSNSGNGVVGVAPPGSGRYAVVALGDLSVSGSCTGCGNAVYRIDAPGDPTNKYINQATMVSSEYLNVYSGNATLDAQGGAIVQLPAWVAAINKDFRYQLTAIGSSAPLYVAQKMSGNQFRIGGGKPGMEVSWQLTGVRADRYSTANPLQVEQDKPAAEKGTYWQPGLYGQPATKGVAAGVQP